MAGKLNKTPANSYGDDLFLDNGNNGITSSLVNVKSGNGNQSSLSISDDNVKIKAINDDTVNCLDIQTSSGTSIFTVDTSNSKVLAGTSQVAVNTHYKEFGFYKLDVTAGYHHPLICNNTLMGNNSPSFFTPDDSMFGNSGDPALTLDLSADGTGSELASVLWYIEDNITIDSCRFVASVDHADEKTLNFHLLSYTLDTSSNYGDLSAGLIIDDGTVDVNQDQVKIGTLSHVAASLDVDAGKVVIVTVENEDSDDETTVQVIVKYHIR